MHPLVRSFIRSSNPYAVPGTEKHRLRGRGWVGGLLRLPPAPRPSLIMTRASPGEVGGVLSVPRVPKLVSELLRREDARRSARVSAGRVWPSCQGSRGTMNPRQTPAGGLCGAGPPARTRGSVCPCGGAGWAGGTPAVPASPCQGLGTRGLAGSLSPSVLAPCHGQGPSAA